MARSTKKRTDSEVGFADLVELTSKHTGIKRDDVRIAVDEYCAIISSLLNMNTCPDDIRITIPHIGKIYQTKKKGLKAGTKVSIPKDFGMDGNKEREILIIEEDRPDYMALNFDFSPTLAKEVRSRSEKNYAKN